MVLVNSVPWDYSPAEPLNKYLGPGTGQFLTIAANGNVTWMGQFVGTFANGIFYTAGVSLQALNSDWTPWLPGPQDLVVQGSLDVAGSVFNFATNAASASQPGFAWLYDSSPFPGTTQPAGHLRWLTSSSRFEWTWEAPTSTQPLMSLTNAPPAAGLYLSVPIFVSGTKVMTTADAAQSLNPFSLGVGGGIARTGGTIGSRRQFHGHARGQHRAG